MEQNVVITLRGKQLYEDMPPESIELVTEGVMNWDGECCTLRYLETELTGMGSTTTVIQIVGEEVTMMRQGEVYSQMVFRQGKRHLSHYRTPYGEMTIGVNFLGTYLLTLLLLPRIADGGNITFTTSLTRYIGKIDQTFFDDDASHYTRFDAYSKSKLATTLLTAHLAEQLATRNIHVNAADPGVVDSNMIHMDSWVDGIADALFRPIISTPQQGAMSALSATKSQLTGMIFTQTKHHDIPQRYRNHPLKEWLLHKAKAIITARKE